MFLFCTNMLYFLSDGVEYGWLVLKVDGASDIFSEIFIEDFFFFLKICLLSLFFFLVVFCCFGLNIYIPDGFCTAAVNIVNIITHLKTHFLLFSLPPPKDRSQFNPIRNLIKRIVGSNLKWGKKQGKLTRGWRNVFIILITRIFIWILEHGVTTCRRRQVKLDWCVFQKGKIFNVWCKQMVCT